MKVRISSQFPCSAAIAWILVTRSDTLVQVAKPLAFIRPSRNSFPVRWIQGETVHCKSYLFGLIPVGERQIDFERIDAKKMEIQTRECDPLIQKWDHLIAIEYVDEHSCIYTDEVEIEAGVMTFFVWVWAHWFYRHRQARWRKAVLG